MQKIDDVKEIISAMHELGTKWHSEIILLREENLRLKKDNERLEKNFNNLKNNLEDVRREIIKELDAKKREDFQEFVEDYLKRIRECVDGKIIESAQKNSTENVSNNISDNAPENGVPDY